MDFSFSNSLLNNTKSSSNNSLPDISKDKIHQNFLYVPYSNNDKVRIIKRNLVYVINIDPQIADKEILSSRQYFGQYGKITKLLVNLNKTYNANNSPSELSYSAYINYSSNYEAALAILSVDSFMLYGKIIKAAFGTTKYCSYYIKRQYCPIKECVYMHSVIDKSDIINKDSCDFYIDQHKLAVKISNIASPEVKDYLYRNQFEDKVLPNPFSIYSKRVINQYIKQIKEDTDEKISVLIKNQDYKAKESSYNEDIQDKNSKISSGSSQQNMNLKYMNDEKKSNSENEDDYCLIIRKGSLLNKASKSRFGSGCEEMKEINNEENETIDEIIIRDYYRKFTISSSYKGVDKDMIIDEYYRKFQERRRKIKFIE